MKILVLISFTLLTVNSFAAEKKAKPETKKAQAVTQEKSAAKAVAEAPCDSKEDLLKKLEEKKKAQESAAKPQAFSLQGGGDTGCSVK